MNHRGGIDTNVEGGVGMNAEVLLARLDTAGWPRVPLALPVSLVLISHGSRGADGRASPPEPCCSLPRFGRIDHDRAVAGGELGSPRPVKLSQSANCRGGTPVLAPREVLRRRIARSMLFLVLHPYAAASAPWRSAETRQAECRQKNGFRCPSAAACCEE
jgi:hypothetical protein